MVQAGTRPCERRRLLRRRQLAIAARVRHPLFIGGIGGWLGERGVQARLEVRRRLRRRTGRRRVILVDIPHTPGVVGRVGFGSTGQGGGIATPSSATSRLRRRSSSALEADTRCVFPSAPSINNTSTSPPRSSRGDVRLREAIGFWPLASLARRGVRRTDPDNDSAERNFAPFRDFYR